jgi:NADH dehydrogenase
VKKFTKIKMMEPSKATDTRRHVVIIGAGFAGLNLVNQLDPKHTRVTLVDQRNHHTFQPLLYQVAAAQLDAGDVARHVRGIIGRKRHARFRYGTVAGADFGAKTVHFEDGSTLHYDDLVIAAGAVYADFGVPGVKEHAFVLKSVADAVQLRSHLLKQIEHAASESGGGADGRMRIVIVGGGPTGVELAGALSELAYHAMPKDYPDLDLHSVQIELVEMTGAVLPSFTPRSQRYAARVLERRGVTLRMHTAVAAAEPGAVVLNDGERIPTRTLIWAAGVEAHPLAKALNVETGRGGRIVVQDDLSLPGQQDVYAAGDIAASLGADGRALPQVAPVAIQHGTYLGKALTRKARGKGAANAFRYVDKGSMAIVGRNAGVAELSKRFGGLTMRGFMGWLAWLLIHLIYLPGHMNRLSAFITWAYEYVTWDKHARLIHEPSVRTGLAGQVQSDS